MADESLTYRLLYLLFATAKRTNVLIDDVYAQLGLSHALADVLWQLDPQIAAPSMQELAGKLHCDPSTVTFLIDRLEERQLVARQVNPADRRAKLVALTPAGRGARQILVDAMTTRSPLARLSTNEQQQLHDLLMKAQGTSELPPLDDGVGADLGA